MTCGLKSPGTTEKSQPAQHLGSCVVLAYKPASSCYSAVALLEDQGRACQTSSRRRAWNSAKTQLGGRKVKKRNAQRSAPARRLLRRA